MIISFENQSFAFVALEHDIVAHSHMYGYFVDPVSLVLEYKPAISRTPHQVCLELAFLFWQSVLQSIVQAHHVFRHLPVKDVIQNV